MQKLYSNLNTEILGFYIHNTLSIFVNINKINEKRDFTKIEVAESEKKSLLFINQFNYTSNEANDFFIQLRNLTTHEHEVKHFHDLLITPFGEYSIAQEFMLLMNFSSIITAFSDGKNTNIEIPIFKSLRKNKYGNDKGIKHFERFFSQINDLYQYENSLNMNSIDIIEGLATCVEMQTIYTVFGKNTALFYLHYMLENNKKLGKYISAIKIIITTLNIIDMNEIHKILFYSLCGDYYKEGETAFPAQRFEDLIFYIYKNNGESLNILLERFYIVKNFIPPEEAIRNSQQYREERIKIMGEKLKLTKDHSVDFAREVFEVYTDYFATRKKIISKDDFLQNYTNLYQYTQNNNIYPNIYYYAQFLDDGEILTIDINKKIKEEFDISLSKGKYAILLRKKDIPTFNQVEKNLNIDKDLLFFSIILNISNMRDVEQIKTNDLYNFVTHYAKENFNLTFVNYKND